MALAVVTVVGVGQAVAMLSNVITDVITKTYHFKSKLIQIQDTINRNKRTFVEIEKLIRKLNHEVDEEKRFTAQMKAAEALVRKCERIKWDVRKRYTHSKKLDKVDEALLNFCQKDVPLLIYKGILDLRVANEMNVKKHDSGIWSSSVPVLKSDVIGFDDQVRVLKDMVLKDSVGDECSVVVVSAAKSFGKTTLVTMLCHDPEIQEKFGKNIYFATISKTPNLKVVIKDLLGGDQVDFVNEDDAINKWGRFLRAKGSDILLVLDDVWSASIIKSFKFKLRGYKIVATSTTTFEQFDKYPLQPFNHQNATKLLRHSAILDNENHDIPDDLVDKLAKCCKYHPLALTVTGEMLKGKSMIGWVAMLNNLSNREQTFGELYESLKQGSNAIRHFYLNLTRLYPDEVLVKKLMDKWVNPPKNDEDGSSTRNHLFQRYSKRIAFLSPIRNIKSSSSLVAGASLQDTVSKISNAIIHVNGKSHLFSNQLNQIREIIEGNKPFFDEIEKLIKLSDRSEHEKKMFITQLKSAETLVLKCGHEELNFFTRKFYALKLDNLISSLLRFCQFDAPSMMSKGLLDLLEK